MGNLEDFMVEFSEVICFLGESWKKDGFFDLA